MDAEESKKNCVRADADPQRPRNRKEHRSMKNWKKLEKPNGLSTVKCTHTGIIEKRRKLSWILLTQYDYISQILNTLLF